MSTPAINLGKKGEALVLKYLQNQGYKILAQNFYSKFGEIDLIAQKNQTISFVEVKLRVNPLFALSDLINLPKQRKIIKTAMLYIAKNRISNFSFRFDVALIENTNYDYKITYLDNAFSP